MKTLKQIMIEYGEESGIIDPQFWYIAQTEEIAQRYKLEILEDVKFGFDICSDHSTGCLGYRNLVERIRREKENQPIDESISPVKPYEPGKRSTTN